VYASFMTYVSGAGCRIGFTEKIGAWKAAINKDFDAFFSDVIPKQWANHEAVVPLKCVEHLGGIVKENHLELWVGDEDREFARGIWEHRGVSSGCPVFCFALGAREKKRMWPVDRFAAVGRWLYDRYGARIVLLGGETEGFSLGETLCSQIPEVPVINLISKTTLRQAAAVMSQIDMYVGNDTGLMHMAAAVKKPVVEISSWPRNGAYMSPNGPRYNPWKVPFRRLNPFVAILPCNKFCVSIRPHCILGVHVPDVCQAVASLMGALSPEEARQVSSRI